MLWYEGRHSQLEVGPSLQPELPVIKCPLLIMAPGYKVEQSIRPALPAQLYQGVRVINSLTSEPSMKYHTKYFSENS